MDVAPRLEIRPASRSDAELLATLAASTFRDAYSSLCDAEELEEHILSTFTVPQIAAQFDDPSYSTLLAWVGGEPVGYATLRFGSSTGCVRGRAPTELFRLYLTRDGIGRGHGSALMRACLEEGKRHRFETIWLGVWEENTRARSFYEKWGFRRIGTHEFIFGGKSYDDLVMARPIRQDP